MQTAYDLVWLAAERTPDAIALVDDKTDRILTYSQLIIEIDTLAAGLHQFGIRPGDRVATILPSIYEHCLLLLSLQRLCAVPALINFRLSSREIVQLIIEGQIKAAISLSNLELTNLLKGAVPEDGFVLAVGPNISGITNLSECKGDPENLIFQQPSREDPAFIFYTSGTSGLPKGVVLSHRSTEHRVIWLATQAGLRHGCHNKTLGFMPLSHVIGFYGVFLVTLAFNGSYYVMSEFNPTEALNKIEKYKITYMFSVPQLYVAIFRAPNYTPDKMRSTELLLYGGAEINGEFLTTIAAEWPAHIRHIYGTTETMCSLYNPDPLGQHKTLRPGFYSRVRVVKLGGGVDALEKVGEEGELIIDASADANFSGYLEGSHTTRQKVIDGWYYTGDLCVKLAKGDIELIGRVDDLIRSGGESIHPALIEAVLSSHSKVVEVAVIGTSSEKWGEAVTACVVGSDISARDLNEWVVKSGMARFKRPKIYWFLEVLPRNAANKILRRELKKLAADPIIKRDDSRWVDIEKQ